MAGFETLRQGGEDPMATDPKNTSTGDILAALGKKVEQHEATMAGGPPRPEGDGWEWKDNCWSRALTGEELERFKAQLAKHRTEWVEKCNACGERREVVECLGCHDNCVVCDTNDHDRPQHCTGGGCADDWRGATKAQRLQIQHCNDCCSCVDFWAVQDAGGLVVMPDTDGLLGRINALDAHRQLAQIFPVDGDPSATDQIVWVPWLDLRLAIPPSRAELEAAGQLPLLDE